MIELNFEALITSIEEKTTATGNNFTTVRLTHEGEAFGRSVVTVVDAVLPNSMKDTFPTEGTKGNVKLYMTSRDYNGRPFYNFRINEFKVIKEEAPAQPEVEVKTIEEIDVDTIPF